MVVGFCGACRPLIDGEVLSREVLARCRCDLGSRHHTSAGALHRREKQLPSPPMTVTCIYCDPPFPLQNSQTPENSKTSKSDSKVTFRVPAKVTQKLLKSDSKVTKTVKKVTFETLLSNFWVTLAGSPKVTFESLFGVFEFSGVWEFCRGNGGSQCI